ncbi:NAD(P)H-binding protein [Amycolatopsis sp. NPDC051371]|jgi:putative NADH-flavin reductase|uniref:NAD(P)-dependent oxidoreductase n=1 Tax=Amycolatopsis sp. NPDC051371 TaxID=3155800 RepID=UPI00341E0100
MRVLILGASGGTGRLLVNLALDRGLEVTGAARNLDTLRARHPGLPLHPVDVRDQQALRTVTAGHDAAISVIGGRARTPGGIYSEGGRAIVQALEDEGVRRFVCVSSGGVASRDPGLPLWYRLAIPLFMRDLYDDMRRMEDIVRDSALEWTIVRASYLVDKPARREFRVENGRNPRGGWKISRSDLAAFLLDQVGSSRWLKSTPTLAY